MKHKFLYLTFALGLILTSCIGGQTTGRSNNPKITTFRLTNKNNKISLSDVKYNIQDANDNNGTITEKDSLPYGTNLDSLIVVATGNKLSSVKIFESKNGVKTKEHDGADSEPDTVNFSETVYIETVAEDKKTKMTYTVNIHAHRQDPDLYDWKIVNSEPFNTSGIMQEKVVLNGGNAFVWLIKTASGISAYSSSDNGKTWQQKTVTGLPNDIDLQYTLKAKDGLYIAKQENLYKSTDGLSWQASLAGQKVNNALFEINGEIFGINSTERKVYKMAGNLWQEVAIKTTSGRLPEDFPVSGASVWTDISANGIAKVYIAGGEDKNSKLINTVWLSTDGAYWIKLDNSSTSLFSPRKGATIFQYDNTLMLVGGQNASGLITSKYHIVSPDYGITWAEPASNVALPSPMFAPRYDAQIIVKDKRIYIFGGQTSAGTFKREVWTGAKSILLWKK